MFSNLTKARLWLAVLHRTFIKSTGSELHEKLEAGVRHPVKVCMNWLKKAVEVLSVTSNFKEIWEKFNVEEEIDALFVKDTFSLDVCFSLLLHYTSIHVSLKVSSGPHMWRLLSRTCSQGFKISLTFMP